MTFLSGKIDDSFFLARERSPDFWESGGRGGILHSNTSKTCLKKGSSLARALLAFFG